MHLIRSKIERPRPVVHLVRDRLVKSLEASVRSGLATFVVGRAGTGKSIAASDLANVNRDRVAWYTVDESDTELEHFAGYLSETLGLRRAAHVDDHLAERIVEHLLGEFFERIEVPNLVIVEDLHLIYDTPWFSPFITRLLPMLPLNVHMLFTTRVLPPVPLWRMRSKQSLSVIDEEALAFTDAEARQLFCAYGLRSTDSLAAVRRTHGRADRLDALARSLPSEGIPLDSPARIEPCIRRTG